MVAQSLIPLVDEAIAAKTDGEPNAHGGYGIPGLVGYLASTSELLPPWPTRQRDIALRAAWKANDFLSGLLYHAQMRLMATPPRFEAKDPTIAAHVEAADLFTEQIYLASEFGAGLLETLEKGSEDFLGTDNGMHLEVLGDGEANGPIEGPALGLRHLDSACVQRTGHPVYPILYHSPEDGKLYKFHFARVISMAQMPSGIRTANGMGFCPMSRSYQIGETLHDQLIYKLEKMGSRPQTQVIYSENTSAADLIKHFMVAEQMMSQLGLKRFAKIIAMGNIKGLQKLDLNNFELFNEETSTVMAMYALAYIWGLNVRTLFPYAMGGGSSDAELSDVAGRSFLPAAWMRGLKHQLKAKVCPSYLKPVFDNQNDEEDQQKAIIDDIRARARQRNRDTKVTSEMIERRQMVSTGEIPRQDFIDMELADGRLEDGTSVAALFASTDKVIAPLVKLERISEPLVIEDNDAKEAKRAIHLAQSKAYVALNSTNSAAQRRRVKQALAALDWLEGQYQVAPALGEQEPLPPVPFAPGANPEEENGNSPRQEPTTTT